MIKNVLNYKSHSKRGNDCLRAWFPSIQETPMPFEVCV
jgi:hypothetical protein